MYKIFIILLFSYSFCFAQDSLQIKKSNLDLLNFKEETNDVLILDNTKTKAGRDFYEKLYKNWQYSLIDTSEVNIKLYLNKLAGEEIVVLIEEMPTQGNSTALYMSMNDNVIWSQFLQPKEEYIDELASNANLYLQSNIINFFDNLELLKSEDESGNGLF